MAWLGWGSHLRGVVTARLFKSSWSAQEADALRFFRARSFGSWRELTAPLLIDDSAVALEEAFRGAFEDDAMQADKRARVALAFMLSNSALDASLWVKFFRQP
jgi:hypothetical protein